MSTPTPATTRPTPVPKLGLQACSHCGCWMTSQLVSTRNKLYGDHCIHCGLFSNATLTKLPDDQCCAAGNTVHTHPAPFEPTPTT